MPNLIKLEPLGEGERRRATRYLVPPEEPLTVGVAVMDSEDRPRSLTGRVHDISETGLSLLSGSLSNEALSLEIPRGGRVMDRWFDPRPAAPFVYKSTSEETGRAYRRTLLEFFRFVGMRHPADIVTDDLLCWRDMLRSQLKSAATVSLKLSVVRSFFEHLRVAGAVTLNLAVTKLVPPPEVSSQPAGRALTVKEVRYLLAGPDREKPEGARDYGLMLVMLRLSSRVSEVCSLRASSVKWSHGRWTLPCKIKGAGRRSGRCPRTSRRRSTSTCGSI